MTSATGRGGPQQIPRPDHWRESGSPTWAPLTEGQLSDIDVVSDCVARYEPSELVRGPAVQRPDKRGRNSAVLIALYPGDEGATMLLTRRPKHMRKHAGEIAFPGGGVEEGDGSLLGTALREAQEEIGLDPSLPAEVGPLDRFVTGASYSLVHPIVARLAERPTLVASPDEVDLIIETSLTELLLPGVYKQEEWLWGDDWLPMHFFELVGETVWGATALMINNLLDVVAGTA